MSKVWSHSNTIIIGQSIKEISTHVRLVIIMQQQQVTFNDMLSLYMKVLKNSHVRNVITRHHKQPIFKGILRPSMKGLNTFVITVVNILLISAVSQITSVGNMRMLNLTVMNVIENFQDKGIWSFIRSQNSRHCPAGDTTPISGRTPNISNQWSTFNLWKIFQI